MDLLLKKIRKTKCPICVAFSPSRSQIPEHIFKDTPDFCEAYNTYACQLLDRLQGVVPAVRFDFSVFSVLGDRGIVLLQHLLEYAAKRDYYVILDGPEARSAQAAQEIAEQIMNPDNRWNFHGLILSCYIGSDGVLPYLPAVKEQDKDLFLLLRTANKSAMEFQDLLTGSRLVHLAIADLAVRLGDGLMDKCGYSRIGGVGAATSVSGLQSLRSKYPAMFLLVDGADYSGANAKNCSVAFDRLGHGALVCIGPSVFEAWKTEETNGTGYVDQAALTVERTKKNLLRYITIL